MAYISGGCTALSQLTLVHTCLHFSPCDSAFASGAGYDVTFQNPLDESSWLTYLSDPRSESHPVLTPQSHPRSESHPVLTPQNLYLLGLLPSDKDTNVRYIYSP